MIFISLEGIDGSGKTTISKIVKDNLVQRGYDVLLTREPGGEPIAEQIRKVILDKGNADMTPWTEALLYIAARKQHLNKVIIPALRNGTIVISDRFMDSTSVYQGFARQIGIANVDEVQNIVFGSSKPDLTIFFDITPQEAQLRMLSRNRDLDRLDSESLEFHKEVYEGYQILINENSDRFKIINARKPITEVVQQVDFLIQNAIEEMEQK